MPVVVFAVLTVAVFALLVTASAHGGTAELRVIDRGPGIPASARERVFQPFQRVGDRGNHTGVGLGLALSRGLADAMGGGIVAEETPGGGVTMILSLPAAPDQESRPPVEETAMSRPAGATDPLDARSSEAWS